MPSIFLALTRHLVYTDFAAICFCFRMRGMDPDMLKQRRKALGLTQGELAEKLGVDVMTVSRWERGLRAIPPFLELAIQTIERESSKRSKK